ncbi:bifunctional diaminohydroxyphosphoribosylaminopyrimidine deaminase/5-amino-6-(5-phosphoribosylamino)uracil reductase RibD [Sporolactobacillus putidus]|uniref:bifunctional diaminohydroxyphosphoribosylaminopyrimidine deaminase/5-amino-6-(5-phosphoribosylamino)uracil reductase RibD n=1 Tax=Sporolactobacillus putidus TaxID=492735 RepID=UPI001664C77A|nr:bifunctional diaminohydroxyphosphoribosylaminopyrimidine deaminase/5-amino-6-(5-phosphoribosylamino)uracil reductase RibD [Sporolactobacillus putidus]
MKEEYMKLAINLARATAHQTSPNPAVGAVVVNNGEIVGMGAHLKAGEAHAEVNALSMAGDRAKGGTIYVTLEPCAHFGRTPPCADLIIKKQLSKVVIASSDPNPLVAGLGIEKLRNAGISVETGVLQEEADALNSVFFHYIRQRTPYVTLKMACSLDGKTATAGGESKWITCEASRLDGHTQRRIHDAILVGIGTVMADDPKLTARSESIAENPIRVVLDTHLRIREDARVVTDGAAATWIFTGRTIDGDKARRLQSEQVTVIRLPSESIAIKDVLNDLGQKGVTSLLVEGGSAVHGSFLKAKAFNRVIAYIAPKLIGGRDAVPAIGGTGIRYLADVPELSIKNVERLDQDLKVTLIPKAGDF